MRVRDAMTQAPITCEPTSSIRTAARLMADHDFASIPVTRSGRLVGIVTDRDIVRRAVTLQADAGSEPVGSIMTSPVITAKADDEIDYAAELMEANAIHHVPVIGSDGTLVGIVAQSDIAQRMTNREFGRMVRSPSIRRRGRTIRSSALVRKE